MSVEVLPVEGLPEVQEGDDLVAMLAGPLGKLGARDGDVVAVTQKIVSKAEGRVVPEADVGRVGWVEHESERVVARRGDLVIAQTRHGFVCANAGVDASNVEPGFVALLPEDPDGSAERLRAGLGERLGRRIAVVVTDTFGRTWRQGVVNVAIGCAGLPALADLRGTPDHTGRTLEATVVALADEVAAASGLVMGKAARVPAAIVRGIESDAPHGRASDLVRPPEEDLFRESPLLSISARRTIRTFGPGDVPDEVVREAVAAACTAPSPHHSRPWRFTALTSPPAKRALLAALAAAWREDLGRDGVPSERVERRIARSDSILGAAPVLIVPWVTFAPSQTYADDERSRAEVQMFLLSAGAAVQNLLLALHAQGYGSAWLASTLFCQEETREVLGMSSDWLALGTVAAGSMPTGTLEPRPAIDLDAFLHFA
ncbi:MAG TPA: coenzyme F420-0:L-glutamate ligase [Actinomycetota bacterium]|nr:coenzyme F420-0:L-glutamate ligase [Actinomycetota bacterium]